MAPNNTTYEHIFDLQHYYMYINLRCATHAEAVTPGWDHKVP